MYLLNDEERRKSSNTLRLRRFWPQLHWPIAGVNGWVAQVHAALKPDQKTVEMANFCRKEILQNLVVEQLVDVCSGVCILVDYSCSCIPPC